ncbi:hypothetical protein Dimus_004571 [Dionaea muscipula]
MANCNDPNGGITSISFPDFPEDVQLCILSLLAPSDLSSFFCTSKHFASLCHQDNKLWYWMCDRKWGSKTDIKKWGDGKVSYKLLYKTLSEYENLIGFWRRIGGENSGESRLVFFEWGPSFVTGSSVSPSKDGGYGVIKSPFIWMSLSWRGEIVNYLDPDCRLWSVHDFGSSEKDLVQVDVSFMGKGHVLLEESKRTGIWGNNSGDFGSPETRRGGGLGSLSGEDVSGLELKTLTGSPPSWLVSEIYRYLANRTSPGASGERAWRRQRRREREKQQGKKRLEAQHFVKIVNCSPTPSRPLQGLWKGICDDMNLGFCLVSYDGVGGLVCRKIGDTSSPFSGSAPIFWTSDATFLDPPFSPEEEVLYSSRVHLRPPHLALSGETVLSTESIVSRMMFINSSYDLVIPELAGSTSANPRNAEGRIWQYKNGTFGFGFLRDSLVLDLQHIAQNGCLLDTIQPFSG